MVELAGLLTHWCSATWPWEVSLLHWPGPLSVLCLAIDFFFFLHYQPTQKGEENPLLVGEGSSAVSSILGPKPRYHQQLC